MLQTCSEALPFLFEKLAYQGMDDTITVKARLEIVDSMLKALNSQKKQEVQNAGSGFSIVINIPGSGEEIVIGGGSVAQTAQEAPTIREQDVVDLELCATNRLALGDPTNVFDNAPEFA